MKRLIALFICLCALTANAQVKTITGSQWVGTWATAPQIPVKSFMPHNNNLSNRSLRQVVKVSVGGDLIRLRFSNVYSTEPVVIRSVYIATSTDSFDILPKTAKYLKFQNKYTATIPAGKTLVSDAIKFDLKAMQKLAITINYTSAPANPTVHMGSRTTSYIMKGVTNAKSDFSTSFRENHWFNIDGIDVYNSTAHSVAIIGNSITDGKGSADNLQNRWPDMLSEYLQLKHKITHVGVLNLGIGNNRVATTGGFGIMAKLRFDRDILMQSGVKTVIIFEGVNDIGNAKGNSETVASMLIAAYKEMIQKAKARHLKVVMATITPFKNAGYYSPFHEAARETVNQWIRANKSEFDGLLDFDELLRDPADPSCLKKEYQSDWLHPNPAGYKVMGEYAANELVKLKLL